MVILVTKKLESKLKHFKKSRYARIFGIHNIQNWICTSKQAGNTLKSDELRSTVHRTNQIKIFLKIYEFSENLFFSFFLNFKNFKENPDQPGPVRKSGQKPGPKFGNQDHRTGPRKNGPEFRTTVPDQN